MEPIQVLIALGSAIIGALLVAFIQPWWANTISHKSRLVVNTWQYPFTATNFLRSSVEEYRELRWDQKSKFRPSLENIEKLRKSAQASTLSKIMIENKSKNVIESVKLSVKNSSEFCADFQLEGIEKATYFGKTLEVGDLMPGAICHVNVWQIYDLYSDYSGPDKERLKITARKYDRIEINYPLPEYITRRYHLVSRNIFFFACLTFLMVAIPITITIIQKD